MVVFDDAVATFIESKAGFDFLETCFYVRIVAIVGIVG